MYRYETTTPRVALGLAALAMTALTLGVAIVAPTMSASEPEVATLAARGIAPAVTEVAIIPGRIEVIGVRASNVAGDVVPAFGPSAGSKASEVSLEARAPRSGDATGANRRG